MGQLLVGTPQVNISAATLKQLVMKQQGYE